MAFDGSSKPERFSAADGRIVYWKPTQGGARVPVDLTNFSAAIVEDQSYDDGATVVRRYVIEGELDTGERLPAIVVPAKQFNGAAWTDTHWGARAIVQPGAGPQMLCPAIKSVSGQIAQRRLFGHVGWRLVDGQWLYLHAGGAIGADGPVPDVLVELDPPLDGYRLPDPPADLKPAILASLDLLRLNAPLAAAVYRAPLCEFCPADFGLFSAGVTGAFKSALQGCGQAHWGSGWNGRHFPANWSSTANHIEMILFRAKDALCVIDDFIAHGSRYEIDTLHAKAERIFRGVGNLAGRGRMAPDTSLRPVYHPRGLAAASGEDVPRGHSLRARLLIDQIAPDEIDQDELSKLQAAAADGRLAQAMAAYLRWLAARAETEDLAGSLANTQSKLREWFAGHHRRTPDALASLMLGVETFLDFAVDREALEPADTNALSDAALTSLRTKAEAQTTEQTEENPVTMFIDALPAVLFAGRGHLTTQHGVRPDSEDASQLGWRVRERETSGAVNQWVSPQETRIAELWEPRGDRIGFLVGLQVWLLPDPALAAVNSLLAGRGRILPVGRNTLGKRLREAGCLAETNSKSHTITKNIGRGTARVWVLEKRLLFPSQA
jgi:hypothetical protein